MKPRAGIFCTLGVVVTTFNGWYLERSERELVGPLSVEEIVRRLDKGTLQPEDPVWESWRDGRSIHFARNRAEHVRTVLDCGLGLAVR